MSLNDISEFLTVRETAQVLQCHPDTVAAMIRRGELKAVRLGRAVRVAAESIRILASASGSTHRNNGVQQ
jgi:excisionase family DNA binding protein